MLNNDKEQIKRRKYYVNGVLEELQKLGYLLEDAKKVFFRHYRTMAKSFGFELNVDEYAKLIHEFEKSKKEKVKIKRDLRTRIKDNLQHKNKYFFRQIYTISNDGKKIVQQKYSTKIKFINELHTYSLQYKIWKCESCHWKFVGNVERYGIQQLEYPIFCPMCGREIED